MTAQLDDVTEEFLASYLRGELSEAEGHEIEAAAERSDCVAEALDRCRSSEAEPPSTTS